MFRKSLLAAALAVAAAGAAQAHVTLETAEAPVGSTYKAYSGCRTAARARRPRRVRVQIPEGVIAVKPMPKAGLDAGDRHGPYAPPYEYYGTKHDRGGHRDRLDRRAARTSTTTSSCSAAS